MEPKACGDPEGSSTRLCPCRLETQRALSHGPVLHQRVPRGSPAEHRSPSSAGSPHSFPRPKRNKPVQLGELIAPGLRAGHNQLEQLQSPAIALPTPTDTLLIPWL